MLDDLMQNLFLNAKNQIEQEKKILEDKVIDFESNDKKIFLKVSANGRIKDLNISPDLLKEEPEMVEDLLVVAINNALDKAEELRTQEMDKLKNGIIPNLDDLMSSFGDFGDVEDVQDEDIIE
ncbi:MAG: YbaB/EbfC family nucleoid-associated protein [Bacteroidales bacterium]|nr:YbaB/EbfC family nucleoid-associated protein [Bacteroidales bacterium]